LGIFDKVKQTLLDTMPDVVNNNDISGQSGEMIWKYNQNALISGSRLIVSESQEAIFVKGGVIETIYGPGSYDLKTENKQFFKSLVALAYGGNSPNTAEIWIVNKASIMEIPWGTPSPISIEDTQLGIPITLSIRCNGAIAIKVTDSRMLFTELSGQGKRFTVEAFRESIKSMLTSRLRKAIGSLMTDKKYSYIQLQNNINELEEPIIHNISEELKRFGIIAESCYVRGFTVVNDEAWQRYQNYQKELASIDIDVKRKRALEIDLEAERMQKLGIDYQTDRQLDIMETAASNQGNSAMGVPISLGVGLGIGNTISEQFHDQIKETSKKQSIKENKITCPKCKSEGKEGAKFCPECGFILIKRCYSCQKIDTGDAKFCPECGKKYLLCPSCGADNPIDVSNCIKCGEPVSKRETCPSCNTRIDASLKFCPECGAKL